MDILLLIFVHLIFQSSLESNLKVRETNNSSTSPSDHMAVSMREVDPAFQGAGQKAYPCALFTILV